MFRYFGRTQVGSLASMNVLQKIPTVLTVAVLVVIFGCLKRHARSARLHLWMAGWVLIFTHFFANVLEPATGPVSPFLLAVDLGSLQAAAIAFLASLSMVVDDCVKRWVLLVVAGVPSVSYAVLASYDVHARWPFIACLAFCFGGSIWFVWDVHRKPTLYVASLTLLCTGAAAWTITAAWRGSFDEGLMAFLGLGFGLPGVFLCRNYWRPSPGVITTAGGFFTWGAVFPVGMLIDRLAPTLNVPAELWNTPKLFAAFGMILIIVEDKTESIERMQREESSLNRQLERFGTITSQLLSANPVDSLCGQIAKAITEVTNFRIAVIELDNGGHGLRIAGSSGLSAEASQELERKARYWTTDDIKDFCQRARHIGKNSFLMNATDAAKYDLLKSTRIYEHNAYWNTGDEMMIPLCSARGGYLGCIALDDPRDPEAVNPRELSSIESLAADLGVALEVKALQGQLVRSEKLAALGQLVAGVAHELNNPLTAVLGYGELLSAEVPSGPVHDRIGRVMNEGRRMKKIVENLLRFSRQSPMDRRPVRLAPLVQDILALREYYVRTHGLKIVVDIPEDLPRVALDEDQFKQILLNLVNNAIDAVESAGADKRVVLRAFARGNRAILEVEDSGSGFHDINRAFDPFYTTKPVGKGTGLGLSICYGIIKEHQGEIRVENLQPRGARVTVDVPIEENRNKDSEDNGAPAGIHRPGLQPEQAND
jgi:two-component system NtrC family sensor kinase